MLVFLTAEALEDGLRERAYALYKAHFEEICRYTHKKLRDRDDAELAATDAFVRMLRNMDKLVSLDDDEVRRRLFGYARAACLDILRKKLPQKTLPTVSVSNAETNDKGERFDTELADEGDSLTSLLQKETHARLAAAIKTLDPTAQQIVTLRYFCDLKNTGIAAELGMNPSTVGTILQRSLKKLRKELEGYMYDEHH